MDSEDNKNDQPESPGDKQNNNLNPEGTKNDFERGLTENSGFMEDLNFPVSIAKGKEIVTEEVNTSITEPNIMKLAFSMSQFDEHTSKESSPGDSTHPTETESTPSSSKKRKNLEVLDGNGKKARVVDIEMMVVHDDKNYLVEAVDQPCQGL